MSASSGETAGKQMRKRKKSKRWLLFSGAYLRQAPPPTISSSCMLRLLLVCALATGATCLAWPSNSAETARANISSSSNDDSFSKIPGLYEQDLFVTPIQGQAHFERLVLSGGGGGGATNTTNATVHNQTISMVQFYMATCPDCQGFSPYFKRLVANIGPHWRQLVRIYVVNCNDDLNINLCWQQNPNLIVPLVRWYTFPILLHDSETKQAFKYPTYLLNVAHRNYIEKQRRDLISLRQATLRFISSILDQLTHPALVKNGAAEAIGESGSSASSNQTMHHHQQAKDSAGVGGTEKKGNDHDDDDRVIRLNLNLYRQLPMRWKLLAPIGRPTSSRSRVESERFLDELGERLAECLKEAAAAPSGEPAANSSINNQTPAVIQVENFIVFERRGSYLGKTIVADWSNWMCSAPSNAMQPVVRPKVLFMLHYTNDFSLLNKAKLMSRSFQGADQEADGDGDNAEGPLDDERALLLTKKMARLEEEPLLFSFSLSSNKTITSVEQLELKLLASNSSLSSSSSSPEFRIRTKRRRQPREASSSAQIVAAVTLSPAFRSISGAGLVARSIQPDYPTPNSRLDRLSQRLSLEQYYTRRRSLDFSHRHPFRYVASMTASKSRSGAVLRRARRSTTSNTSGSHQQQEQQDAISRNLKQLVAENINWAPPELYPGEESLRHQFNKEIGRIVFATDRKLEDLPGFESDNSLGEINTKNRFNSSAVVEPRDDDLSRLRLTDYYKVLTEIVHKNTLSKAELDGWQFLTTIGLIQQLKRHFPFQGAAPQGRPTNSNSVARRYLELLRHEYQLEFMKRFCGPGGHNQSRTDRQCEGLMEDPHVDSGELKERLAKSRVPGEVLQRIQERLQREHDVGLPAEGHFKWSYCLGSSEYLRGHTCSLWVLFHTLTAHEHLQATTNESTVGSTTNQQAELYKFKVKKAFDTRLCDPKNPEPALLNSTSVELFVESRKRFVLASIINFVRFYLACTNCAAHFSCMVKNSELDFEEPEPAEHLLWLWEAHNRVNLRTRNTHSEDPTHPKHVFPVYEACPACYLERPPSKIDELDELKFNRQEVVNFLVARYRRSAILNNKIKIEDLYRKPVPPVSKRA